MQKSLPEFHPSQRVNFLCTLLRSTVRGSPSSFLSLAKPGKVLYILINNAFSAWNVYDSCLPVVQYIYCVVCKPLKVNSLSWVRPRRKMCEICTKWVTLCQSYLSYNQRSQSLSSLSAGFIVARWSQDDKHVLALFTGGMGAFSEEHVSFCWPAKTNWRDVGRPEK